MKARSDVKSRTMALECPRWFKLRLCALSHGWVNLAPYSWDDATGTLGRVTRVGNQHIELRINQRKSRLLASAQGTSGRLPVAVFDRLKRALFFPHDLSAFCKYAQSRDKRLASAVRAGYGHFLRGESRFEDAAKTLLTTNCSWANTVGMVRRLCDAASGGKRRRPAGFPKPAEVLRLSKVALRSAGLGYRASYMRELARAFSDGNDGGNPCDWIGFGPYAESHMRFLDGNFEEIPVDREVCRAVGVPWSRTAHRQVNSKWKKWGKWRFLAYKLGRRLSKTNWIG